MPMYLCVCVCVCMFVCEQIDAFKEGFHQLMPPDLISIFTCSELELLMCGLPSIDVSPPSRQHTQTHTIHIHIYIYIYVYSAYAYDTCTHIERR